MKQKGTTNASPTTALAAQASTTHQAAEASTAQAGGTAATDGGGAVVSAEAAGAPAVVEAPRGHGGHYRKVNGVRVLVERTLPADEAGEATKADQA